MQMQPAEQITNHGILKSIVGMLNADGGRVVVGVLETDKFKNETAHQKLRGFPAYGRYTCVGIEMDLQGHDWDWYHLRLQDIIKTRISPSPSVWVTFEPREFQGVRLCMISVRAPDTEWFYLLEDPKKADEARFYVREGPRTRPVGGLEADRYKRAKPR
ncbi:MAG: ATP-binding protein [Chloroflexi bacterium]|nr:ATP-binding protein [Chloroflexota bacterium]